MAVPRFHEPLRHAVLDPEVLGELRLLRHAPGGRTRALQPRRHAGVGRLSLTPHPGSVDFRPAERPVCREHHVGDDGHAILVLV